MENYKWDLESNPLNMTNLYAAIFSAKSYGSKVDIVNVSFDDLLTIKSWIDVYYHVGELNKTLLKKASG